MTATAGTDLVARLRDVLANEPTVVVAYLFGSRATGSQRVDSDVDVAVLLHEPAPDDWLRTTADLAAAAAPLRVDLVDLAAAPVALAYRVLRDGRLLISRDEAERIAHRVRAFDRYLDMAPARRVLAEGTRRRLREGLFGRP